MYTTNQGLVWVNWRLSRIVSGMNRFFQLSVLRFLGTGRCVTLVVIELKCGARGSREVKRFETAVLFSWEDGDIGDAEAWVARSALAAAIGGIAEAGAMSLQPLACLLNLKCTMRHIQ